MTLIRQINEALAAQSYKAVFITRDHKDEPDRSFIRKAKRSMPNSIVFEFGNKIVDEYVTVITDCPYLEQWITFDDDSESVGHAIAGLHEGDFVSFSNWADLLAINEKLMDQWTAGDHDSRTPLSEALGKIVSGATPRRSQRTIFSSDHEGIICVIIDADPRTVGDRMIAHGGYKEVTGPEYSSLTFVRADPEEGCRDFFHVDSGEGHDKEDIDSAPADKLNVLDFS